MYRPLLLLLIPVALSFLACSNPSEPQTQPVSVAKPLPEGADPRLYQRTPVPYPGPYNHTPTPAEGDPEVPNEWLYTGDGLPSRVDSVRILQAVSPQGFKQMEPRICFELDFQEKTPCYLMDEWLPETPFQPAHARFRTDLFGTWFWMPEQNYRLNYQQGPASGDFYPEE